MIHHTELEIPVIVGDQDLFGSLAREVEERLPPGSVPIRFAIPRSTQQSYFCEVAAFESDRSKVQKPVESIFGFRRRNGHSAEKFTAVLLVPTGIGAEIGGHAGDAGPLVHLFGAVCDRVVTHPNVVNASDINELPSNALYVEGSAITRLLMGTVGLQPVRSNRVLVVLDSHKDESFVSAAINSVSAARASYGFICPRVVVLDPPLQLTASYSSAGTASGQVHGFDRLCRVLDAYKGEYDAVAISSVIGVPPSLHAEYFQSHGEMINPWGGVEAILTHAVSSMYGIPSAHSPMLESEEVADEDPGVVDPRMAAEAVSIAFLQCILKGLQRSPRIVQASEVPHSRDVIFASDVSCLVLPVGCLGLPTLAALEQGIPVIAVRENQNVMQNDLTDLPWRADQLYLADNYWEAVGIMAALKAGISPESIRRPLQGTRISRLMMREPDSISFTDVGTGSESVSLGG
jgi:hypothetical protein